MLSQEGRAYRQAVAGVVVASRAALQLRQRLVVVIEARMPDRRKRDIDNLPKAVLDALTHAGVWADDEQIDDLRIWRSRRRGGTVIVTVSPIGSAQRELAA